MTVRVSIAADDVPQNVVVTEICNLDIYNTNPFIYQIILSGCDSLSIRTSVKFLMSPAIREPENMISQI